MNFDMIIVEDYGHFKTERAFMIQKGRFRGKILLSKTCFGILVLF